MEYSKDDLEDFVDGWSEGERLEKRAKALEMEERRKAKRKREAEEEQCHSDTMADAFKRASRGK